VKAPAAASAAVAAATATATKPAPAKPEPRPADQPQDGIPAGADADQATEPGEEEDEGYARPAWMAVPSWLVSAVVHLILLLTLAFMTFTLAEKETKRFLVSDTKVDEAEDFEEVVFQTNQIEVEKYEAQTISGPPDPGISDFGQVVGVENLTPTSTVGLSTIETEMVDIGTLFGTDGEGMAKTGDGQGGAQFFGVKSTGNRFVFIVDSSKSMKSGKFEAACYELAAAVDRLSEQQSFYVIFFDWDAYRMFNLKNPEPRMVRATPENVMRLRRWMSTVELELRTDPFDAFKFAMHLMPDAIYVLSDGAFTDKGKSVKWLKKENTINDPLALTPAKVTVHTIGFYTPDKGTLAQMAKDYGGTYRFVPRPPGVKKKPGKKKRP